MLKIYSTFLFLQSETGIATANLFQQIILAVVSAFVGGFFLWLFTRNKTNSETGKNKSETYAKYVETIAKQTEIIGELRSDIDGWFEKVSSLRRASEAVQDENRELRQNCKDDNQAVYDEMSKIIRFVLLLEEKTKDAPECAGFYRETVRLTEMLTFARNKINVV